MVSPYTAIDDEYIGVKYIQQIALVSLIKLL